MTQNKAQKIAIRRRMAETGESYVAARRAVLEAGGVEPAAAGGQRAELTPEEQYALEAEAAGVSAEQIDTDQLVYRLEAAAERAQAAAEQARERAERAEEEAEQAEDRAGRAEEAASEAEPWAEPAERQLLHDRAEQLLHLSEQARERAIEAENAAVAAEERADMAADAAGEAANGEFAGEPEDDPGWVWAEATSGSLRPMPPRPPSPPMPPR